MEERSWENMQSFADELPPSNRYCSDELAVYSELWWPANPEGKDSSYVISHGKDETYTIEGVNADLRTYLGRLKRKSRCFSRSLVALWHYAGQCACSYGTTIVVSLLSLPTLASRIICVCSFNHSLRLKDIIVRTCVWQPRVRELKPLLILVKLLILPIWVIFTPSVTPEVYKPLTRTYVL